ncbi:MAG: hypothetical protein ACOC8Y_06230 [Candidatus Natronoplasma sp.]
MHPTVDISGFKQVKEDWDRIIDLAVHLSEAIGEHIKKPEIISRLIKSSSAEELDLGPANIFENSDAMTEKREYLQEERKKLQDYLAGDQDPDIGEKVKDTLMSVWEKIISRSNTITRLQDIGSMIYERLIEKLLPFDFTDEDTPIWSKEKKDRSTKSKLAEHFEDKIKENMRNRIRARIEQRID